jgi:glucose-6-phosphate isomerase
MGKRKKEIAENLELNEEELDEASLLNSKMANVILYKSVKNLEKTVLKFSESKINCFEKRQDSQEERLNKIENMNLSLGTEVHKALTELFDMKKEQDSVLQKHYDLIAEVRDGLCPEINKSRCKAYFDDLDSKSKRKKEIRSDLKDIEEKAEKLILPVYKYIAMGIGGSILLTASKFINKIPDWAWYVGVTTIILGAGIIFIIFKIKK